ncbi:uncharacterized protein LOC110349327 [Heterocephalus glaber]|uniref:Uncharacterized protein LOC110349327 n=1 Tax=Heterocephalus glaber TaxID=10181 RepID=A0AAX6T0H7_HETGA|nr:uncharacterized protein LOC110349327 [Heterocephalus glaber]
MPSCRAGPDRAPLSRRPLSQGLAEGPGSPGLRGHRSRRGRPMARTRYPVLAAAPSTPSAAEPRQTQKGRERLPSFNLLLGASKAFSYPQSSSPEQRPPPTPTQKKTPIHPQGLQRQRHLPSGRCPRTHHNFETLDGRRGAPAWIRASRASFPTPGALNLEPRRRQRMQGPGLPEHSPRLGCAPRGPAPSPISAGSSWLPSAPRSSQPRPAAPSLAAAPAGGPVSLLLCFSILIAPCAVFFVDDDPRVQRKQELICLAFSG